MDARDRHSARPERTPAWHAIGAWGAAALLVAALVAGCGPQPATPTPIATTSPTATPAPTPTPVAYSDTLRFGIDQGMQRGWALWDLVCDKLGFGRLVYSALSRCDGQYDVIPDLTEDECFVPRADGKVLRCRLIDTTFQDGTPLTADDVAYTYQLFNTDFLGGVNNLEEARVVDPRTVEFVLKSVDPAFVNNVLPIIPIFPRHAVEAAHADLMTRLAAAGLSADDYTKLSDTINDEINRDPAVCSQARVDQADALYATLDINDYHEDHPRSDGTFDRCWYLGDAAGAFWNAGYILGHTGNDRLGAALGWNAYFHPLPGTGPYRLVYQDATTEHLEAWAGYHGGTAATRYVDIVKGKADASDLVAGTIDIGRWVIDWTGAAGRALRALAPSHGVKVVTPPDPTWFVDLNFYLQPGHLFTDVNLRRALQLCIDLPRDVDAVTAGAAVPIYSPVLPGSEAYATDPPKPERDVAAAKRLIEASGWTLGADGVFAMGRTRLATTFPVRLDDEWRVKMSDLIALQARDCGFDLQTEGLDPDKFISLINDPKTYPDLAIVGFPTGIDAADGLGALASSEVANTVNCACFNTGWSDPAYDKLVGEAADTYDQAERVRLYRQAQGELASQLPVIFLWRDVNYSAVRSTVQTVERPARSLGAELGLAAGADGRGDVGFMTLQREDSDECR